MVEAATWNSFFQHAALSDVGLRRANNQDSLAVALAGDEADWRRRGHLFMIADGMGAHAAGEMASRLACTGISHTYRKMLDRPVPEALRQALIDTNGDIHSRGQANIDFQGMGTTTSVLVLLPQGAVVAHVGDSRVYRLREQRLEQLTFDHSLVWEMRAAGQLPTGDVPSFVPKNIITRSLGPHPSVQVDMEGPFPLAVGDRFLLCSDGLSGQLEDAEIGTILGSLPPAEAAQALIDVANLRGGPDNITAIVVEVVQPPPEMNEADAIPTEARSGSGVHGVLIAVAGLCLAAAAAFAVLGKWLPAALAGLGVVTTLAAALWQRLVDRSGREAAWTTGPLGRGPHTATACAPSAKMTNTLAQLAQQLRETAAGESWTVNWARFDALAQKAAQAASKADHAVAVKQYAQAVSFMMNEIRHQRAGSTTGSVER